MEILSEGEKLAQKTLWPAKQNRARCVPAFNNFCTASLILWQHPILQSTKHLLCFYFDALEPKASCFAHIINPSLDVLALSELDLFCVPIVCQVSQFDFNSAYLRLYQHRRKSLLAIELDAT